MILTTRYEGNIFLGSVMKNCLFVFGKDVLSTRNQVFSRQSLLVFSEKKSIQKSLKKIVFFLNQQILRKQSKNKTKTSTHRFLGNATYNACAKFQGKLVNPTLNGAPGTFRF